MSINREPLKQDIRALSSRENVAAFFIELGYDVNPQTVTPASLGLSPESLVNHIRHIELIATQDDYLRVYLFEMRTLRVADRQALARSFRNRDGDFLLVLTTQDYDELDFVLLERTLPEGDGSKMSQKQVVVRPRVLSVDRRDPFCKVERSERSDKLGRELHIA